MKLISPEHSDYMRNFVMNHKNKVIDSDLIYDSSENEPSDLEDRKRVYFLNLALVEFSSEVFIVYFPEKLDMLNGQFPKTWKEKLNNLCLIASKDEIEKVDDIVPEYYIFDKDSSKFIFVDAEGNISFTHY